MIPKEYFLVPILSLHRVDYLPMHEEEEPKQAFRIKAIYIKNLKMSEGKIAAQKLHMLLRI
jgi:hypothetical protein